jgi:hypothetical protein
MANATNINPLPAPWFFFEDTTAATTEAGEPGFSCGYSVGKTVWYKFSVATTKQIVLTTAGSNFDTVMAVYEDTGGMTLVEQLCNDDYYNRHLQSRITFEANANTTYYVGVGGYSGDYGLLNLHMAIPDWAGSYYAIEEVPFTHQISTMTATESGTDGQVPACDLNESDNTIWYLHSQGTSQTVFFDTASTDFDTTISVWRKTGPVTMDFVTCDDDSGIGLTSQVQVDLQAGETYYIIVGEYAGAYGEPIGDWTTGGNLDFGMTTFGDVPHNHAFFEYIEGFADAGITGGCSASPPRYCPGGAVTRAQMAVFILRAINGPGYSPPPAAGIFSDVPANYFQPWIEAFYNLGITGGCGTSPLRYCPNGYVTRAQMAVFILRGMYNSSYTPPAATGVFSDVPADFFQPWIEDFYNHGITGGCGTSPLRYCPNNLVTRGQMAVFIDRGFWIPLLP